MVTKMRQPSFVAHVQVLFALQTPAVTLSSVSSKPGLSQGWADQVRQDKE